MLGDAPVFTAKVTQCAGGGSVLGVCMSHAVSDGQGFIEFLVTWAKAANNGEAHPWGDPGVRSFARGAAGGGYVRRGHASDAFGGGVR